MPKLDLDTMYSSSKTAPFNSAGTADKVQNIQALRGVAALLVVWAHLKFCQSGSLAALPGFLQTSYGAIGVDVFFIISGYVISVAASKRHQRPLDFFCARIARVSPLYLVATLFFMGKDLFHLRYPTFQSVWNGFLYLPVFDWADYTEPPLGPGWTLSFEMWFYTVFALLLNAWHPRKVALALPFIFAGGAVLLTAYHPGWYFPRFMFHPFTLEFAFGCLIFHLQNHLSLRMAWFLLSLGVLLTLAFAPFSAFLGWHQNMLSIRLDLAWERVFLWGAPSALIVGGLLGLERQAGYVLPRLLVGMGDLSYSLYLTHLISIQAAASFASRIGLNNIIARSVLVTISCVILAWFCWRWIERPLTKRAQNWTRKFSARHLPASTHT